MDSHFFSVAPVEVLEFDGPVSGNVSDYRWKYYVIEVLEPIGELQVDLLRVFHHGNPELYLQYNAFPTSTFYHEKALYWRNPYLRVKHAAHGKWYIGVFGSSNDGESSYILTVKSISSIRVYILNLAGACPIEGCGHGECQGHVCICDHCYTGVNCQHEIPGCSNYGSPAGLAVGKSTIEGCSLTYPALTLLFVLVLGGIIAFIVIRLKNRRKSAPTDLPGEEASETGESGHKKKKQTKGYAEFHDEPVPLEDIPSEVKSEETKKEES